MWMAQGAGNGGVTATLRPASTSFSEANHTVRRISFELVSAERTALDVLDWIVYKTRVTSPLPNFVFVFLRGGTSFILKGMSQRVEGEKINVPARHSSATPWLQACGASDSGVGV